MRYRFGMDALRSSLLRSTFSSPWGPLPRRSPTPRRCCASCCAASTPTAPRPACSQRCRAPCRLWRSPWPPEPIAATSRSPSAAEAVSANGQGITCGSWVASSLAISLWKGQSVHPRPYRAEILSAAMLQDECTSCSSVPSPGGADLGERLIARRGARDSWQGPDFKAPRHAASLYDMRRSCFLELCDQLREACNKSRYPFQRLRASLVAFDAIWVQFEEAYVRAAWPKSIGRACGGANLH